MRHKCGFKFVSHTADIGLKFWGDSFPEMLVNSAKGMFSLIVDRRTIRPVEKIQFRITGKDYEDITINWLREIHFFHQNELFVLRNFRVDNISEKKKNIDLYANCWGEHIDKHFIKTDIKLVTYHKFYVKKLNGIWEGFVIFDI